MLPITFPDQARTALLQDAASRDQTTARRVALLEILWHERFLTRDHLVARVEAILGRNSFGKSAWEDTFYRDIRAVKQAFRTAGYSLAYRRHKPNLGYYLENEPPVSLQISAELAGAAAELNLIQSETFQGLTPARRAALGTSISRAAREAVARRIMQQDPNISSLEANRLALQRAYTG
jgi:hypothetical protein